MAVTQQPGSASMVCSLEGNREFSTALFDCFSDCKSCICAYFCLPCTLCSISSRMGECALMPFCVAGSVIAMRARLRTLGGIRGSICNDCLVTSFCGSCAVCQMDRELTAMGL